MAQPFTLYRFQINYSDIDRGVYKTLDFRMAMHPSESKAYLMTRLIAFVLNEGECVEFASEGLGDPELPAILKKSPLGEILLWIEIGNPSSRKLHKATKAAKQVKVYTYKDPALLLKEIRENKVYHAETIEIYSLEAKFLEILASRLERKNSWDLLLHEGFLNVSMGTFTEVTDLKKHQV